MVTDDVGAVPLVLLLHRAEKVPGVTVVVVVTAEQAALPTGCLKRDGRGRVGKHELMQKVRLRNIYCIKLDNIISDSIIDIML